MANIEQLMSVGQSCDGYDQLQENAPKAFESSIGGGNCKSCTSCTHFVNGLCDVNLFDKVLTELDQT